MSKPVNATPAARKLPNVEGLADKLRRSRHRLLDLTLRNRLLSFRPGNPQHRDDHKGHKHVSLRGHADSLWQSMVKNGKPVKIVGLTRDQQAQIAGEMRLHSGARPASNTRTGVALASVGHDDWEDVLGSIRGVSQVLGSGNLISLLPEEAFRKRLTKIRNEQNTLANSTGDSALFLAIGFLEWCEAEPRVSGESLFAPLILVHAQLRQRATIT